MTPLPQWIRQKLHSEWVTKNLFLQIPVKGSSASPGEAGYLQVLPPHLNISETKLRARAAQGSGAPFSIQSPLIGWNFYTRHSRPRDWDPNHPHFNSLVGWEVPHSEKEALNVDYHSWPAPSSQNGGITLRDVVLCPCTQLWNSDSDILPMGRGRP